MMVKQSGPEKTSIQLYYMYAHADVIFSHELEKHLANLQRQSVITEWHSREISPATDGKYVFDEYLTTAQIILLLISPNFLALDFCYGVGMQQALERDDAGEATIIPVILRPVDWRGAPFGDHSVLPDNEEPISAWLNRDEAYLNIIEGIQDAVTRLSRSQSSRSSQNLSHEQAASPFSEQSNTHPIKLFYAYTGEDQNLRNQLEKHLTILQRQGFISVGASRDALQESVGEGEIDPNLSTAQIILLLISPDFLASEYSYSTEIERALERHQAGEATVIPVILRHVFWEGTPFYKLPSLPSNGAPVISWPDPDAAFLDIVQGVRKVITTPSSLLTAKDKEQEHIDIEETLNRISLTSGPIKIFYSYSHGDETLLKQLQIHLTYLQRQEHIVAFYDRLIAPGTDWMATSEYELNTAHIILLLVSADYLASDLCYTEMRRALERAQAGEVVVIPIILRHVDWGASPIGIFQPLPTDGRPVTAWENLDEAFYDIAQGIREVVLLLAARLQQETKEQFILEGKTYYDARSYDDALAAYRHALNLDPKDELVSSAIGRILLQLGRYEEALDMYEEFLRISTSASAYLFKGIVLQHLGRLTDALGAYQKAREHGFAG